MELENSHTKLIIKPKKHILDVNISELWQYRDLLMLLVRRDFIAQYKQTILGPIWYFITPLINVLIYVIIFNKIAGISTDGIPPVLFYLSGLTLWNYFASTLQGTSNTFVTNSNLFGKVYFPRLIIPLSLTLSSIIRFAIQFGLLVVAILYYWYSGFFIKFNTYTYLLPVILFFTALLSLSFGIIISSMTTKYRDLQYVLGFGIQLWMYITPIIYPVSILPERLKWIVTLNPMAPLIEGFRYGMLGIGSVSSQQIIISFVSTIVLFFFGIIMFNKVESTFMDTV